MTHNHLVTVTDHNGFILVSHFKETLSKSCPSLQAYISLYLKLYYIWNYLYTEKYSLFLILLYTRNHCGESFCLCTYFYLFRKDWFTAGGCSIQPQSYLWPLSNSTRAVGVKGLAQEHPRGINGEMDKHCFFTCPTQIILGETSGHHCPRVEVCKGNKNCTYKKE